MGRPQQGSALPPEKQAASWRRRAIEGKEHKAQGRRAMLFRSVLGLGLAAYLIGLVLSTTGVDLGREVAHSRKLLLFTALAVYGLNYPLTAWRWDLLLRVQGIRLGPWELLRLLMIGVFFNLAVPGAVGGDVVKAVYLAGRSPGRRVEAMFTILADRVLGLLGLLAVAAVSVVTCLSLLAAADPRLATAAWVVGLGGAAGLVAVAAVVFRRALGFLPAVARLRGFLLRLFPERVTQWVRRVLAALDLYRETPRVLGAGFLLSLGVHSAVAVAAFLVGRAVHETALGLGRYFLSVQVANAVAMIPVTPGGLGGRDLVLSLFLSGFGAAATKAGAIPALFSAMVVFWGLVGGVFFIFHPLRGSFAEAGVPPRSAQPT